MNYGYARVSTKEQNEERQIVALVKEGINKSNIFLDKQSGKDFNRTNYKKLLRKLKETDVIFVKSIDRLGRNYEEIIGQWRYITKDKKADIVVLDMPLLDTRKTNDITGVVIADIILQLLSYVAQKEREFIRQRQKEGIELAKEKGIKFGRPKKELPENFSELLLKLEKGKVSINELLTNTSISRSTLYRRRREMQSH